MRDGLIFDIEEFGIYDGPGIRAVIFMKGCPLRCRWCHNPEGLEMRIQRLKSYDHCTHCGACDAVCHSPNLCTACGACVRACPNGLIEICGQRVTPEFAAARVGKIARLLKANGGGVTFSGGEALMQPEFVIETRQLMPDLHAAIETSGYADSAVFDEVISNMDLVMFDIKHTDVNLHIKWTGVNNDKIYGNLQRLIMSGKPFIARTPLIPGVNDDDENMRRTAEWLRGAKNLLHVELLKYNKAAGAKYRRLGRTYMPGFDEASEPHIFTEPFTDNGIEVLIC